MVYANDIGHYRVRGVPKLREDTKRVRNWTGVEETSSNGSEVGRERGWHTSLEATAFLEGFCSVG